jgi:hypothetical protein
MSHVTTGLVLIAFLAFAIGGATPVLYSGLVAGIHRVKGMRSENPTLSTALVALAISLSACGAGLTFVSMLERSAFAPPTVAVACTLGVGVVRRLRKEI